MDHPSPRLFTSRGIVTLRSLQARGDGYPYGLARNYAAKLVTQTKVDVAIHNSQGRQPAARRYCKRDE